MRKSKRMKSPHQERLNKSSSDEHEEQKSYQLQEKVRGRKAIQSEGRIQIKQNMLEKKQYNPKAEQGQPKQQKKRKDMRSKRDKVKFVEEPQQMNQVDAFNSNPPHTESSDFEERKTGKPKKLTQKQQEDLKKKREQKSAKLNSNYQNEVQMNQQLESPSIIFNDYESVENNNKEVIRAAFIRSQELLEDILSRDLKLSSLFQRWGPENSFNALEIMFKNNDVNMVEYFIKILKERKIEFTQTPECSLNKLDIEYNVQDVNNKRGQKEGIYALIGNIIVEQSITQQTINNLLMNPSIVNPQLYYTLLQSGAIPKFEIYKQIPTAIRAGNHQIAKNLIENLLMVENQYDDYWIYAECLGNDLDQLQYISLELCTKKIKGFSNITPIHIAATNPDPKYLIKMLELTEEYNIQDELGRKPIHYAAVSNSDNCLQYLLDNQVDPGLQDQEMFTPLMLASQFGKIACVKKLLDYSKLEDIFTKNKEGNTAIHLAAQYGNLECLKELLDQGGEQKVFGSKFNQPLHLAAAYGHQNIVRYLLEEKNAKNIDSRDIYGRTPLIMAARNGNLSILQFLLQKGAKYQISDHSGNNPMHYAAAYGFAQCLFELRKVGCDLKQGNSQNLTPLSLALARHHYQMARQIIEFQETEVNFEQNQGKTLLISSLVRFQIESKEYIKYLIENKNVIVSQEDHLKRTALHYAVELSAKLYKSKILEYKKMHKAKRKWYKQNYRNIILELIQLLIKKGADINSRDSIGNTPFMIAIKERETDLIGYFIDHCNPDYTAKDRDGKSLLHLMIDNKSYIHPIRYKKFQTILSKLDKEQVTDTDEQGFTPFLYMLKEYTKNITKIYQKNLETHLLETQLEEEIQQINPQILPPQIQAIISIKQQEKIMLGFITQFLEKGASLYEKKKGKQIFHYIFKYFPDAYFIAKLSKILEKYKLVFNTQSQRGLTPLHVFCLNENNSQFYNKTEDSNLRQEFLIYVLNNFEIDIHIKDHQGRTATHILAVNFEEALLDILLQKGGQINIVSKDNVVPIIHHVNNQNISVVKRLLQKQADPNFQDLKKRSSLHHAVNNSCSSNDASYDMEDLLLKNKAKADIKDIFMRTPIFYYFVKIGQESQRSLIDPSEKVLSLLAQEDCNGNMKDIFRRTPLHYAAMRDSVYSAISILKFVKNVKFDEKDSDGNTPLALAFLCGHHNFVRTMIDYKAAITGTAIYIDRKKLEYDHIKELQQKQKDEIIDLQIEYPYFNTNQSKNKIGNKLFQNEEQDVLSTIIFPTKFSFIPVPSYIKPGRYNFFELCIQHEWSNMTYFLIQSKFDNFIAIEESLKSQKFQLVKSILSKVREDQVSGKTNNQGMNLYHLFSQFGMNADQQIQQQILEQLENKHVPYALKDNFRRTPLHYAAKIGFNGLQYFLLSKKVNPNEPDIDGYSPYSYALQRDYSSVLSKFYFPQWKAAGVNIQTKFKVNNKDYKLDTFMYLIQERQNEDKYLLNTLLQYGADINTVNQDKESALYLAIRWNNQELFDYLLKKTIEIGVGHNNNKNNETVFHVVVQPLSYGSYENTYMLEALIKSNLFNINQTDNQGRTPLDYALKQKTSLMANILKNNGAHQVTKIQDQELAIKNAQYPIDFPDYRASANQKNKEDNELMVDPRFTVDPLLNYQPGQYEVLIDNGQPYSIIMTKIHIVNSFITENLFFKIQLLHETNKEQYILFTRQGRIGEPGQIQKFNFDKHKSIDEFHSLFQILTDNTWLDIVNTKPFQSQPGLYILQNFSTEQIFKQLMTKFDFSKDNKKPYPFHYLEKNVARFIQQLCQFQLYQRELQDIKVDQQLLPLERLQRVKLSRANLILKDLQELVIEVNEERNEENLNENKIFELFSQINELSSKYYQMIPFIAFRTEPSPPLETILQISQQTMIIKTLRNLEVASKILIGALQNSQVENPLSYCFKSMQIRVQTLAKNSPEFEMIDKYIKASSQEFISNIFAIERKSEIKRFQDQYQNHSKQLLWHGSKISNLMAILAEGLEITSTWVYGTGSSFEKGLLFADTFEKSYEYSLPSCNHNIKQYEDDDEEQKEIQRYRYLLLCEVATGNIKQLCEPVNVMNFQDQYQGFDSLKYCGKSVPDPSQQVILDNGTILPQGQIIINPLHNDDEYQFTHNEYIVFDVAQVKIRYLIQIDTQCENNKFI